MKRKKRFSKVLLLSAVVIVILLWRGLAGWWQKPLQGVYYSADGYTTMEFFENGVVKISENGQTHDSSYEIKGKRAIIRVPHELMPPDPLGQGDSLPFDIYPDRIENVPYGSPNKFVLTKSIPRSVLGK